MRLVHREAVARGTRSLYGCALCLRRRPSRLCAPNRRLGPGLAPRSRNLGDPDGGRLHHAGTAIIAGKIARLAAALAACRSGSSPLLFWLPVVLTIKADASS